MRPTVPMVLLLIACSDAGSRGTGPAPSAEPVDLLLVGSSLTEWNNLPDVIAALADSVGHQVRVEAVTGFRATLDDHWSGGPATNLIRTGRFDFVVLEEGPAVTEEERAHLRRWVSIYAGEAAAAGSHVAVLSVWPPVSGRDLFDYSIESYRLAAADVDGTVVPVAAAWLEVWRREPFFSFYWADGFNPAPAGTYLAALVVLATLTDVPIGNLPDGAANQQLQGVRVHPHEADLLQTVASLLSP